MIATMFSTTVSLILACFLGVSGIATGIDVRQGTMVVNIQADTSWSFGGSVFVGSHPRYSREDIITHEYGHILQEQEFGPVLYFLLVAIPSLRLNYLVRAGKLTTAEYFLRWPEIDADVRGNNATK